MSLKLLKTCLDELNTTNSMTEKKKILAKYPDTKTYFEYAHNPDKQFGITSANLLKLNIKDTPENSYVSLTAMLDDLASGRLSGHEAHRTINDYCASCNGYGDIVHMILDKNLKVRLGIKQINQVWPNTIKEFKVTLAKVYEEHKKKVDYKNGWYASRKLDGVRCIAKIDAGGNTLFYSRTGKPFTTLGKLAEEIKELGLKNCVLDGELCMVDENGDEDFSSIVKLVRKKDYTIPNPEFLVFDMLSTEDFDNAASTDTLVQRHDKLVKVLNNKKIKIVNHELIKDENHLKELTDKAEESGWEGIMIRKNVAYKGKRTDELLKLKKFKDDEFKVVSVETGPFRIISQQSGLEEEILCMTKAIIMYKENEVGVGSGWSHDQRVQYYYHPEQLIGKQITVKYFEECKDAKTGKPSLRFPTLKRVHEEGERTD